MSTWGSESSHAHTRAMRAKKRVSSSGAAGWEGQARLLLRSLLQPENLLLFSIYSPFPYYLACPIPCSNYPYPWPPYVNGLPIGMKCQHLYFIAKTFNSKNFKAMKNQMNCWAALSSSHPVLLVTKIKYLIIILIAADYRLAVGISEYACTSTGASVPLPISLSCIWQSTNIKAFIYPYLHCYHGSILPWMSVTNSHVYRMLQGTY